MQVVDILVHALQILIVGENIERDVKLFAPTVRGERRGFKPVVVEIFARGAHAQFFARKINRVRAVFERDVQLFHIARGR